VTIDERAVDRAIAAVAGDQASTIRGELDRYGTEPHEREINRVRMAILKLLSEEGLHLARHYVDQAKMDYREILVGAEYPAQMSARSNISAEERERLVANDAKQYAEWLERYAR
jgi:hypothetical protein